MSKMYIANCTRQVQDFQYRMTSNTKVNKQTIQPLSQIAVSGDLSTYDIDAIVSQHSKYGLVRVDEIDRTKPFIGVCYSIDRPINVDAIRRAMAHNDAVLIERGRQIREEAAVAVNSAVEQQTQPMGGVSAMEFEVVENERKDGSDTAVNEKIRVTRTEEPSRGTTKPPRKRRGG